ncbi:MAG: TerC family protein [Propionibacteriaceae bacterium]|nr:TerC family protein [Propionibacteriaceae bacterium]
MTVPLWVWAITIAFIVGLLLFDFIFHVRQAHIPTLKEAAFWSAVYVGVAVVFGVVLWAVSPGHTMGVEYFAGYITEKALSVDNLFVFLVIMSSFAVPRADQQKVLLFGIVFALISRSALIFAGKAMIDYFEWTFYIFGLILIVTAGKLLAPEKEGDDEANNFMIRLAKKYLRTTDHYDGDKLFTYENGRRVLTPMLLVMVAIGLTDVLFAFDSVPAIYGLTTDVYIVFTATAFSLMGLRQLYFLIDGLLDRLIYLKYGLSLILAFIGVKLVLHALHENSVPFINGGEPVPVIEIETTHSLLVILGILTVTVIASLASPKGRVASLAGQAERAARAYLEVEFHADPEEREAEYAKMLAHEKALHSLDAALVEDLLSDSELSRLLERAHAVHIQHTT